MAQSKRYNMLMSEAGYTAMSEIAREDGRLLADVIREALEQYAKRRGRDVSFAADRGGYRGKPKKQVAE